jgi:uncharacterized protein (DUF2267 family)
MGNPVSNVPAASSTTAAPDPSVVVAHLAALPPLTDVQRQAFREQFTRAQCTAAAGDRAEGTAVLAEALDWVPLIHDTLSRYPALVRRYGRTRFAWLLECIRDLDRAKEIQDTRSTGSSTPSARSERNRYAALRARDDLILALGVLAEGNEAERALLAATMGTTDTKEALVSSLRTLAQLAADWLERDDHVARALVASIDLATADVEAARAAARALSTGDGVPEAHAEGQDPPAVNLAVGRVLLEMGLVLRVFERIHRWDDRVPELVPGPATRVVLTPAPTEGPKLVDAMSERVFQRIEQSGALPAGVRAPKALRAVMGLLSAQLTGGQAVDMAVSLPPTLRALLQPFGRHTDQWPDRLSHAEFTQMMAQHLQMTNEHAEAVIDAVFSAVRAAMPADEVAAVEAQLPDEARRLWGSQRRAA